MRLNLKLSVLGCALASVIASSLPAAADWHKPYIYRESNGSWTNVRYDDGICNYYFSRNTYDNKTNLNKSVIARTSQSDPTAWQDVVLRHLRCRQHSEFHLAGLAAAWRTFRNAVREAVIKKTCSTPLPQS